MIIRLLTSAFVDAERVGGSRLSWSWVFLCEESAVVLARSEPMFRTRSAAMRVGNYVMASSRARSHADL